MDDMSDPGVGAERDAGLHFDLVSFFELKQHVGDELIPVHEPIRRSVQLQHNVGIRSGNHKREPDGYQSKQEFILVGCVPPTTVAICWGGVCLSACWDTLPGVGIFLF